MATTLTNPQRAALLPIDDELRGALSREIAYEDNLYFMRSLMGAGIKTSKDTMTFLGDMRATSKAMGAANLERIKELKGKEVMSNAEYQGRIDTDTAGANQMADTIVKSVSAAVAMNPRAGAGAINAAGREAQRIKGDAAAGAATRADIAKASLKGQVVEELLVREDKEIDRKQSNTRAKFDAAGNALETAGMVVAATRPRTREAQLEKDALKGAHKGKKIAGKLDTLNKGDAAGFSDRKKERIVNLTEKQKTVTDAGKAAGQEAALLNLAKQTQAQKDLAAYYGKYTPFNLAGQPPKPLADWEKPATGLSVPKLKYT